MDAQAGTSGDEKAGAGGKITDKARGKITQLKDGVQERTGQVLETAHAQVGNAQAVLADSLEARAEGIRGRVGAAGAPESTDADQGRLAGAGKAVAGTLEGSATWLRENDLADVATLVRRQLKEHPGRSALAVLAIGVLLGRASKRS